VFACQAVIPLMKQRGGGSIIFTGSEGEREFLFTVAEELKHLTPRIHIRTRDSLIDLAHILCRAKLVVSGNLTTGTILMLQVDDINKFRQYSVTLQQVARTSDLQLELLSGYSVTVSK